MVSMLTLSMMECSMQSEPFYGKSKLLFDDDVCFVVDQQT
jgi:hypothetical protein